MWLKTFFTNTL